LSLECIAGGRWTNVENSVTDSTVRRERRKTWYEPLLGLRAGAELAPRFSLWLRADAGGYLFGSDLTWNVSGLVNYQIHRVWSLILGYKIYDVDYETGSNESLFRYDVQTRGLFFGMVLYL
jgi:hypothetical protein